MSLVKVNVKVKLKLIIHNFTIGYGFKESKLLNFKESTWQSTLDSCVLWALYFLLKMLQYLELFNILLRWITALKITRAIIFQIKLMTCITFYYHNNSMSLNRELLRRDIKNQTTIERIDMEPGIFNTGGHIRSIRLLPCWKSVDSVELRFVHGIYRWWERL